MSIITVVYVIACVVISVSIILDKRPGEATLGWLLIITLLPGVGLIFFLLFGINWQKIGLIKNIPEKVYANLLKQHLEEQYKLIERAQMDESEELNDALKNICLLNKSDNSLVTTNNSCKLYYEGEEFFNNLINDISNAKKSIHMEFFIWRSDELGEKLKEVLIKRANDNVKIKLIFDSFGSFFRISFKYRKELRNAGIEYKYFLDVFQPISGITRFNNRNHRKVVVIDDKISYTGGMNVGIEYVTGGKRFNSWRDTQVRFEGDVSAMLQILFLTDWENSGGTVEKICEKLPSFELELDKLPIQLAVSGPDSSWSSIKLSLFNLFSNANSSIYIQSPYLIPDEGIISALQVAALSGVEVNLMMAGLPDKKIPFWAAETYIDDLLKAGVHVYQYMDGFFHSKTIVIDGRICSIGTTNMDVRSFKLNYEVNAVIYNEKVSSEMVKQFGIDVKKCKQRNRDEFTNTNFFVNFRNSLCRILSPIM